MRSWWRPSMSQVSESEDLQTRSQTEGPISWVFFPRILPGPHKDNREKHIWVYRGETKSFEKHQSTAFLTTPASPQPNLPWFPKCLKLLWRMKNYSGTFSPKGNSEIHHEVWSSGVGLTEKPTWNHNTEWTSTHCHVTNMPPEAIMFLLPST